MAGVTGGVADQSANLGKGAAAYILLLLFAGVIGVLITFVTKIAGGAKNIGGRLA